ncbi:MAG: condensation domain-containing protein, partial [Lysobacter sp.]
RMVFAHPTLAGLCRELSLLQRGVFEPMALVDRDRPLPLSYSQQRLWYIHQLEGGSAQYHLPTALRLHGDVDIKALQGSFDRIVERHEILRTVYQTIDGKPMQRVLPARAATIACTDLSGAAESISAEALADLLRADALRPFDFGRDLMLRVHVFTLAPREHVLLCTLHHIASDGWSMGVLTHELATLYRELAQGSAESLPPMTVQYGDFAVWQRAPAQVQKLDEQLAYWTTQLAELPPVHSLPLDRPRSQEPCYDGGSHRQVLDGSLTAAVKDFARDCDATLFMCLQSVLSVVLMRWGNAREIAIGSPVAGRSRGDLDASIGLYVNTLVFRHVMGDESTFRQAVVRSRRLALDAYAHQDVPFEMLVEALRPARSLNLSPLFQVMFVLQNNEHVEFELAGIQVEGMELGAAQTKFDLSLSIREVDGQLGLHWSY